MLNQNHHHLADNQAPLPPHLVRHHATNHGSHHAAGDEGRCDHCEYRIGIDCAAIVRFVGLCDESLKRNWDLTEN